MTSDDDATRFVEAFRGATADARQSMAHAVLRDLDRDGHRTLPGRILTVLGERRLLDLATDIASYFLPNRVLRKDLLWQLSFLLAVHDRPAEAASYLDQGLREGILDGPQILFSAIQHARQKDQRRALYLLDYVARFFADCREEAAIHRQFFALLWTYDVDAARGLFRQVEERFATASIDEVEAQMRTALDAGQPYLLLRMGDGEGAHVRVDPADESRHREYYNANRCEFLDIWFRDRSVINDPAYDQVIASFNEAIREADCIGGIYQAAIEWEYSIGSRRGIAWVVNTMRKVLSIADQDPAWAARTSVHHLGLHYDLLLHGCLARLLQGRRSVGLISCHGALPAALARTYGIGQVEFHKVPGEQAHGQVLGADAVEGRHWPDRFRELSSLLGQPSDRRGQLFLVAAGLLGKVYAKLLKASGAVVIDIGAVADLWMGKMTRSFPQLPPDVALRRDTAPVPDAASAPAAPDEPFVVVDVGGSGGLSPEWEPHLLTIRPIVFEPNPPEAELVRAKLAHVPGALVLEQALGNWAERRVLNVTKSLGCTSLLKPNRPMLSPYSISPAFDVTHQVEVDCVRYDSLVEAGTAPLPDAVKIDVQGFEYQVLTGFGEALKHCLGVTLEAHFYPIYEGQKLLHDLVTYLSDVGLVLRRLVPVSHFDGDVVEVDAWFTCSVTRAAVLPPHRARKLSFLETVWKLSPHRATFGADQFL